ncbi:uncharacterized protein LOC111757810 [Cavia porcellus]|uniref:uncharacterized protein LOC111757810 n=1 Tax=Cavia porcellus TaxID=10141 RepID=UPI000C87A22F|nr:uncharacterized protein LOC111757810 [Cavia porcellus]
MGCTSLSHPPPPPPERTAGKRHTETETKLSPDSQSPGSLSWISQPLEPREVHFYYRNWVLFEGRKKQPLCGCEQQAVSKQSWGLKLTVWSDTCLCAGSARPPVQKDGNRAPTPQNRTANSDSAVLQLQCPILGGDFAQLPPAIPVTKYFSFALVFSDSLSSSCIKRKTGPAKQQKQTKPKEKDNILMASANYCESPHHGAVKETILTQQAVRAKSGKEKHIGNPQSTG